MIVAKDEEKLDVADLSEGDGFLPAQVTTDLDLDLEPVPEWEKPKLAEEFAPSVFDKAGEELDKAGEMISGLRERNLDWMKGKISGDVADQLRAQGALSARSGGVAGSGLSRNLQARDFGLTSMDIQQRGLEREGQLAQFQQGMAQIHENRSQFLQQIHEQSRQFGANHELSSLQVQLGHRELMLKQEAFNADQNMRLVDLISNATLSMTSQQMQAASAGIDDAGITETYNNLMGQLERLLAANTRGK